MSLFHTGLTFLHFNETYGLQNKFHSYSHENIDFSHLEHSNLYCKKRVPSYKGTPSYIMLDFLLTNL
ncbi:hypothetical protein D0U04_07725 [Bacillus clarus]|uniref:Uncharacterized protein n=1 Tax=Bacillus clarus TaxID=2338372 RepID=A0A090YT74_9BACI|nr:hypothetical protein DJ93_4881 [Bacillus clarus]RFT67645.1 hypothetical protein D0U04_07725 [Bacillus clarus]